MNYYSKFAEMLGLTLDEEFKLKAENEVQPDTYRITDDGLQSRPNDSQAWRLNDEAINQILNGILEIEKLKWTPKLYDWFYVYEIDKPVGKWKWYGDSMDLAYWKSGNCFRTIQKAETKGKEIVERIQKEYSENQGHHQMSSNEC